jgi:hypothetical protein
MVKRSLSELTDPSSIVKAMDEFDSLGQTEFLSRYGYGKARDYFLIRGEKRYDSKAVCGVAFGYQHATSPLESGEFSGGANTVARRLRQLGFTVVNDSNRGR